jgi:hypothetical protein
MHRPFSFGRPDFWIDEVPGHGLTKRKDNPIIFPRSLYVYLREAVQNIKKSVGKAFIKAKKFEFFGDCRNHFPISKL